MTMPHPHPAVLALRGVTTNRLIGDHGQGVDLDLPLDKLVVMTGPSGSGKSSLTLDTLAAESRRRLVEALGRERGHRLPRPPAAFIANLPAVRAVVPDVRPQAGSTVGGVTALGTALAALALSRGERRCPVDNTPIEAGGRAALVARLLERPEGEVVVFCAPRPAPTDGGAQLLDGLRANGVLRLHVDGALHHVDELTQLPRHGELGIVVDRLKLRHDQADRLAEAAEQALLAGNGQGYVLLGAELTLQRFASRPYSVALGRPLEPLRAAALDPEQAGRCSVCSGGGCIRCASTGLSESMRSVAIGGRRLDQLWMGTIDDTLRWWRQAGPLRREDALDQVLDQTISMLAQLSLGGLPLLRPLAACAASERARLHIAAALCECPRGTLLIVDEPGAHLDPPQAKAVLGLLRARVEQGEGVLVVDHNEIIRAGADLEVRFGPGAGPAGGRIIGVGPPRPPARPALPPPRDPAFAHWIEVELQAHGCVQSATLRLPRGGWTTITGNNGAGKSTALQKMLMPALASGTGVRTSDALPAVPWLGDDRRPPGGPRSVVATAIGVWGPIRAALAATREARERGWGAERFSFNKPGGRCEACEGTGEERSELGEWSSGAAACPQCRGGRFAAELDAVRWRGHSAGELLQLDVTGALDLWSTHPRVHGALRALVQAGLGYLGLGQRTDTLSGGEAQRLSFAQALSSAERDAQHGVLLLDAPGAGLHEVDAAALAWTLDALRGRGLTLVIADPGRAFRAPADVHIDLSDGRFRAVELQE